MRAVHGRAARVRRDPPIAARAHGARPHATDGTARTRVARRPNTRQDKGCEAVTDRGSAVTASVARMPRRSRRSPRRCRRSPRRCRRSPRRCRRNQRRSRHTHDAVAESTPPFASSKLSERPCDTSARALFAFRRGRSPWDRGFPRIARKQFRSREIALSARVVDGSATGTRPRAPWDRTHLRGSASTLERDPCRCDECQWIESQRPRVARAPARSAQRSSARGVAEDSRPPARDSCATPRVRGRPGRGFPLRSMRMGLCLRGAPARRR